MLLNRGHNLRIKFVIVAAVAVRQANVSAAHVSLESKRVPTVSLANFVIAPTIHR